MTTEVVVEKKKSISRKFQKPKRYKVIVCNDDVTPVEFVVGMLMSIFKHSEKDAYDITLTIHNSGSGIAGIYNYEIAEQKTIDAINLSRMHGWPLLIKYEEE